VPDASWGWRWGGWRGSASLDFNGAMRADLPAGIAPGAEVGVDDMLPVGVMGMASTGQCWRRECSRALWGDHIADQRRALAGGTAFLQVRLVFSRSTSGWWPRDSVRSCQSAQAALADLDDQMLQFRQVPPVRPAGAQQIEDFQHPLRADAAEGALPQDWFW